MRRFKEGLSGFVEPLDTTLTDLAFDMEVTYETLRRLEAAPKARYQPHLNPRSDRTATTATDRTPR